MTLLKKSGPTRDMYLRGTLALFFGLIILFGAGYGAYDNVRFMQRTELSTAVVTAQEKQTSIKGPDTWTPTLRYTDHVGTEHEVRARGSNSAWDWPVGTTIDVRFDPANWREVSPVADFTQTWTLPAVILVIGMGLTVFGIAMRRQARLVAEVLVFRPDTLPAQSSSSEYEEAA